MKQTAVQAPRDRITTQNIDKRLQDLGYVYLETCASDAQQWRVKRECICISSRRSSKSARAGRREGKRSTLN